MKRRVQSRFHQPSGANETGHLRVWRLLGCCFAPRADLSVQVERGTSQCSCYSVFEEPLDLRHAPRWGGTCCDRTLSGVVAATPLLHSEKSQILRNFLETPTPSQEVSEHSFVYGSKR